MEHRKSREIPAPPASTPPPSAQRMSQMMGTRRTIMRVVQRKSVGMMAVYEQDPVATQAGARALVFETPAGKVRVEEFPAEWQRLSDDQLAELRRAAS